MNTKTKQNLQVASSMEDIVTLQTYARRGFLKKAASMLAVATVGAELPFSSSLLSGALPAAIAAEQYPELAGKEDLVVLGDRPFVAETPAYLLNDPVTPAKYFFIRNNGIMPSKEELDASKWTLTFDGESVKAPKTYTLAELKKKFKTYTYRVTLECGGNGRFEFNPPSKGNQWTVGGVGFAEWTGVRLKDVLADVGVKPDAVYIGYYGADKHLNGKDVPISRGVPMNKAMENETLLAFGFNGAELPWQNGYPLRLIVGGYPASVCGKWLTKIVVRNKEHDGPKMKAPSYRMPCEPVAPGVHPESKDMCILENMPTKSIITMPKSGGTVKLADKLKVGGKAWTSEKAISAVEVSIDFGQTWSKCSLEKQKNRYGWQEFKAEIKFPKKGYYEVWAKATDSAGKSQPMVVPGWNPEGYANNATHRIAVQVTA